MGNCISVFRRRSRPQTVSTTTRNQRPQPTNIDQPMEDEVIASTVTSLRSQSEEPSRDDSHNISGENDGVREGIAKAGTSIWNT